MRGLYLMGLSGVAAAQFLFMMCAYWSFECCHYCHVAYEECFIRSETVKKCNELQQ